MTFELRAATAGDCLSTRALTLAAFSANAPRETAAFLDALRTDGCILGEWVVEDAGGTVGHVAFSRVWIETADRYRLPAAMLTPMSVRPDCQRRGIGTRLAAFALAALERQGETLFLVLGHPEFYARVGFSADLAKAISGPWSGSPAFMARCAEAPCGRLVLPRAIANAP